MPSAYEGTNIILYQYSEYSLIIFTNDHVFRVFINDLVVEFDIFEKQYFLNKLENNHIFRENEKEFYYIYYPEPYTAECSVINIEMISDNYNQNISIVFSLTNGRKLLLQPSELVVGTMDSWIE